MILVTGGSGHIGQAVIALLGRLGKSAVCLARQPLKAATIPGFGWKGSVKPLSCDLADADAVRALGKALGEAEAVVHLGGHVPEVTGANEDEGAYETLHANAAGTAHLLEALSKSSKLRSFVYASSFEVYGAPLAAPISEDHPTRPATYYGATKLAGEKLAAIFAADRKVPVCSLRLPAVYGPGDGKKRALGNFVRAAAEGRDLVIQGDGEDRRELVFVADVAEAIVEAVMVKASGVVNVGTGRGYSVREMAECVARVAGGRPRIVTRERVKERIDVALDASRARKLLEWEPRTPLEDGVRAQYAWVKGAGS